MRTQRIRAPRVMFAAPKSGSGKTMVTCAVLALLKRRGIPVRAFKCGPDYIDPLFHRQVLGVDSRSLDTFFTGEELTRALFAADLHPGELSVMEGVMGYLDGLGGTELTASSQDLAAVTRTPVILVVDARGMSRSVTALIRGFQELDPAKRICGVFLNRVSPMMVPRLSEMIRQHCSLPVVGSLPQLKGLSWESRHLGLTLPEEIPALRRQLGRLSEELEHSLDLELLLSIAGSAPELSVQRDLLTPAPVCAPGERPLRIALARDEAFGFIYPDNLRLLRAMGAEVLPFSPLRDAAVPESDGLLLYGGYPELHARELEENEPMRESIRALTSRAPTLAECGGFMALQQGIRDRESAQVRRMWGVLPGVSAWQGHLVRFGYTRVRMAKETGEKARVIRAHEFHYYDCERAQDSGTACTSVRPPGGRTSPCMVSRGQVLAGWPHLYYYSCPEFARDFLVRCRRCRDGR